jgi:hypothetical protein
MKPLLTDEEIEKHYLKIIENNDFTFLDGAKYARTIYEKELAEIKKITRCDSTDDFKEKEKFYKNLVKINAEHFKVIPSLEKELSELREEINRVQEKYDENGCDLPVHIQLGRAVHHMESIISELREDTKRKEELLTAQLADALEDNKRKDEALKIARKFMKCPTEMNGTDYLKEIEPVEQALNLKKQ